MHWRFWVAVKNKKDGSIFSCNSVSDGMFLPTTLVPKGASLEVIILADEEDDFLIFRSDKKGGVFPVIGRQDDLNFVDFNRNIGIGTALDGSPVTLFPDNKLNVVVFGPNYLDLYQVAVVARRGQFYLVISKMAENAEIFWDGTRPVCPQLSKWEELGSFISEHYEKFTLDGVSQIYRLIEDYQPEVFPLPAGCYDEGVVEFYDPARGFGLIWIMADDGTRVPARAFWSEIEGEPLVGLRRGQVVSFESLTESPTSSEFDFELHGVKVVAEK